MKTEDVIDSCLFCPRRPVLKPNFVPVRRERMLFGPFRDTRYPVVKYGLCEDHAQSENAASIRQRLFFLAETVGVK